MKAMRLFAAITVLLALGAVSCSGKNGGNDDQEQFAYHQFYQQVSEKIWNFPIASGDWADDQGDAAYYGLAYYINTGTLEYRDEYKSRASEAKLRDLKLVKQAIGDTIFLLNNLEEVMMAELGLIEYMAVTGNMAMRTNVDQFLDNLNSLVDSMGPYLDVNVDSWALKMYGPTTITGVIALINLRYAELLKNDLADERIAFAEKFIAATDEKAWAGTFYRFRPGSDWLELYPNAMLGISNAIAFKLTGKEAYKTRALACYNAIQPLKARDRKGYYSPYSAEWQGARTEDYTTLSSQNYTIMMMAELYELTGDAVYKQEIDDIVSFVKDMLWNGEKILHHWMDGRAAIPTDPEYFCSGCNLQFIYVIWYVEQNLYGK